MRTVSDATASGVTSLRLLRSHLMCRTGSSRPFRIRVASLWHLIFHACISAPRGGPRGEAPRPSGCRPTNLSPYLRVRRFHIIFFPAFSPSSAPRASALRARLAVTRRRSFALRRTPEEAPQGSALQRLTAAFPQFPPRALPRLLLPLHRSSPPPASSPNSGEPRTSPSPPPSG